MADFLVKHFEDNGVVKRFRDQNDGTWAEVGEFPLRLLTNSGGPNARLRVDVGQTGFFTRKEARTFREFKTTPLPDTSIAAGASYVLRVSVPINIILMSLDIEMDNGQARVLSYVGGTQGGVFSDTLPVIPTNNMNEAPPYTPVVGITGGGTYNLDGVLLDVVRLKVVSGTGQASSVGSIPDSERGVAAGTYYIVVQNIGTGVLEGVLRARWEERP